MTPNELYKLMRSCGMDDMEAKSMYDAEATALLGRISANPFAFSDWCSKHMGFDDEKENLKEFILRTWPDKYQKLESVLV